MNKFLKGFYFAWRGLRYAFRTQINFRVEVLLAVLVLISGSFLDLSSSEWLWILAAIGLVLIAELINTAIETLVDLVSPEFNVKAGMVKDISAGMVLLSAFVALTIGVLVLLPKILHAS